MNDMQAQRISIAIWWVVDVHYPLGGKGKSPTFSFVSCGTWSKLSLVFLKLRLVKKAPAPPVTLIWSRL